MNRVKADFLRKVCAYFDSLKIDFNGKNICVCLSGGADSVALLRAMLLISERYGFSVSACHFNHMIRGDEADRDEEFCKVLCKGLFVKLYCGRDDVPANAKYNKISLEEAARNCRYAFFERICSKENIDYCATAHNMNDDAETLLLNLVRGSGVNGASAISPCYGIILRPFLKIKREDIERFLTVLGQNYVTDSTNASCEYTRNFIRHSVFPELIKLNPSLIDAFSRYIESCRTDREYFDMLVEQNTDSDLSSLHKAVRTRIFLKKFKELSGQVLNSAMLDELEKCLLSGNRRVLSINAEYDAVVCNGRVDFFRKEEIIDIVFPKEALVVGDNLVFGERVKIELSANKFDRCENFNKLAISDLLSFDNIDGDVCVRSRQVGDKICIRGVNRSLKKLFIEKKIPKEYRNIIPIIFDDSGILYVPFVGVADRAYYKNSQNVLYIRTSFNMIDTERWTNADEQE